MNKVLLTGRLTRDPEMRSLASGKSVTQFSVATNEYAGGKEKAEPGAGCRFAGPQRIGPPTPARVREGVVRCQV